jgi:hypothetical protein
MLGIAVVAAPQAEISKVKRRRMDSFPTSKVYSPSKRFYVFDNTTDTSIG